MERAREGMEAAEQVMRIITILTMGAGAEDGLRWSTAGATSSPPAVEADAVILMDIPEAEAVEVAAKPPAETTAANQSAGGASNYAGNPGSQYISAEDAPLRSATVEAAAADIMAEPATCMEAEEAAGTSGAVGSPSPTRRPLALRPMCLAGRTQRGMLQGLP